MKNSISRIYFTIVLIKIAKKLKRKALKFLQVYKLQTQRTAPYQEEKDIRFKITRARQHQQEERTKRKQNKFAMELAILGDPTLEETISNMWSPALLSFYIRRPPRSDLSHHR